MEIHKHAVFALFAEMCWPAVYTAMLQMVEKVDPLLQGRVPVDPVEHGYTVGGEVCCDMNSRNE